MLRLKDGVEIYSVPGEESRYTYQPMGVGVIIAPWNFPTAILTGMSSAAIVAGNTVIMKPSEFTSVIGAVVAEIFEEAGLPEGVLNFLPGYGSEVGDYLVEDARTRFISFTGSMKTGLQDKRAGGQADREPALGQAGHSRDGRQGRDGDRRLGRPRLRRRRHRQERLRLLGPEVQRREPGHPARRRLRRGPGQGRREGEGAQDRRPRERRRERRTRHKRAAVREGLGLRGRGQAGGRSRPRRRPGRPRRAATSSARPSSRSSGRPGLRARRSSAPSSPS